MLKARLITFLFLPGMLLFAAARTMAQTNPGPVPALSQTQKQAIQRIQAESEKTAAAAARRLAVIVRRVYENMLADKPDERLRARLSVEMKSAAWEALTIKGQSIRGIVNVLTPEQKRLVQSELRKPGASTDLTEIVARTFKITEK